MRIVWSGCPGIGLAGRLLSAHLDFTSGTLRLRCWAPAGPPFGAELRWQEARPHGAVRNSVTAVRAAGPLPVFWVMWPEPGMTTR